MASLICKQDEEGMTLDSRWYNDGTALGYVEVVGSSEE